jgi:cytoskeletal protein RodZ
LNISLKLSEDIKKDEFIKNIISARESKNISIQAAAQYLHISENIIAKLEKGDFEEIPNDIFIIGHIRTYLNWIEINPNLLLKNSDTKNINLTNNIKLRSTAKNSIVTKFYILLLFSTSMILLYTIYII